jgi:hypothetical protein
MIVRHVEVMELHRGPRMAWKVEQLGRQVGMVVRVAMESERHLGQGNDCPLHLPDGQ